MTSRGVVAKSDPYLPKNATWMKIRNRDYSQWIDRQELFERDCAADPDFELWNACAVACAESDAALADAY